MTKISKKYHFLNVAIIQYLFEGTSKALLLTHKDIHMLNKMVGVQKHIKKDSVLSVQYYFNVSKDNFINFDRVV